ncbi:MAG: Rne/Rng family ribonuclease [Pseudomonadota bacterium]
MAKKMLIDATHPEETRVVVADGKKVDEFDFESLNKRQLAGNIYLAKVTRVEPSLQAAFVDYGGNRHGFLAFSEIHPDYYQIPKADRDALLAEERAYAEAQAAEDEADEPVTAADGDEAEAEEKPKKSRSRSRTRSRKKKTEEATEAAPEGEDVPAGNGEEADGVAPTAKEVLRDDAKDSPEVVTGSGAELSEAAESEATSATEPATADTAATEDPDEDGPTKTIAEDTGLEDKTVTEGETEISQAEPDVAPAAEPTEEVTEADTGTAEAPPAGMEMIEPEGDGEAETIETKSADLEAAPVEEKPAKRRGRGRKKAAEKDAAEKDETVETVADDDAAEEIRPVRKPRPRRYKIQEVVKVRQIMLVQVVKEERGNKGAALTTYLSLAGRYCVLMPNTARGGGISRKITNAPDRKKLKEIANEIDVPQGAGLIIRTAGAKRTKTEIKRDYEYLQRQWEQVRELTLKSIAPAPIYEEGNLIHRSIRDLYSREIDEVFVEGEAGYREAKDYMKLIMPSHAKNVKLHEGGQPLFAKHGVESYLASMFNPTVHLPSGGYIVIGITEALVAVDVNSGKATKEGSIEETALKTNLEAATEVARQAKLRDLAGLIVIDFIDMDERKNNNAVEKRLKDALKNDRARIQVGRISGFGLLEMSRQRLRPGMLEATTQPCPHCHGTGLIRSDDSIALQVLRLLEEEGTRRRSREVLARVPVQVANYLLNEKREHLASIEMRFGMAIRIEADPMLIGDAIPALEKFKTTNRQVPVAPPNVIQTDTSWTSEEDEEADAEADAAGAPTEDRTEESEEEKPKKRRRRRSRRRGRGKEGDGDGNGAEEGPEVAPAEDDAAESAPEPAEAEQVVEQDAAGEPPEAEAEAAPKKRRRSSRSKAKAKAPETETVPESAGDPAPTPEPAAAEAVPAADAPEAAAPAAETAATDAKPKRRARARAKAPAPSVSEAAVAADAAMEASAEAEPAPEVEVPAPEVSEPALAEEIETKSEKPKRRGWWSFGN